MKILSVLRICFILLFLSQCLAKSVSKTDRNKRNDENVENEDNDEKGVENTDIEEDSKSGESETNDDNNENSSEDSERIEESQDGIKLLIILVDGFRWDYVSRDKSLKGFPKIAENGVRAQYVKPIFPANSYPNWFAISTGLYAESHGMIENYMYDKSRNDLFLMSPHPNVSHNHWWNQSEPIWISAHKNGIKSAMYLWDGCQVRIGGIKASICDEYRAIYDGVEADNQTRVYIKNILDDFSADKYRLALLYHELVDHTGHVFGPRSGRNKRAIRDIDDILNDLFESIKERQLEDEVNVVIVSDHGMLSKDDFQIIHMEDILDFNDVELFLNLGAIAQILPEEGKDEEVYQQLRQAQVKGLNVYKKDNIPERFHFKNNKNVLPILITADEGYIILPPNIKSKVYPENDEPEPPKGGGHGYDPDHVEDMRAIMYAFGPAFRTNYESKPLEQVDHYNLFCHLIGINPNPNNGTFSKVQKLFKEAESDENSEESDENSEEEENDGNDEDGDGVAVNKIHSILICCIVFRFSVSLFKSIV